MLSDKEKKEMLEDGSSQKRKQAFLAAEQKKPKSSRDLNDYIVFLTALQKIEPIKNARVITLTGKNIL